MIFLRAIDVEVAQSQNLNFCFRQNTPYIIIEGKFGKSVNVQWVFRFGFLCKSIITISINCCAGGIKEVDLVLKAMIQQDFGIFIVIGHHVFAILFGGG